jgi:SAM-dependent methyltransferase
VLGIDICEPFLAVARAQATGPVQYLLADAQTHEFRRRFDRCFSRFGAMFFDRPPDAFANLRRALRAGGRLAIVVWGRPDDNAWVRVPLGVIRNYLPVPQRPLAPGPFSLADESALKRLLETSFEDVRVAPLELPFFAGATIDDAVSFALQLGPAAAALREAPNGGADVLDAVRSALAKELQRWRTPRGVELASRALLATATAGG